MFVGKGQTYPGIKKCFMVKAALWSKAAYNPQLTKGSDKACCKGTYFLSLAFPKFIRACHLYKHNQNWNLSGVVMENTGVDN